MYRDAPPNSFSFGPLAHAQLKNLVLTQVSIPIPFERVARLDFSVRPGEAAQRLTNSFSTSKFVWS